MKPVDKSKIRLGLKGLEKHLGGIFPAANAKNAVPFVVITITIFLVNLFISTNLLGGQVFFVNWAVGRSLFVKGISPYSQDGLNLVAQIARSINVLPAKQDFHFLSPLFSIFLYFPFTIISSFTLARALWLTLNEILLFFSSQLIIKIIGWNLDQQKKNLFAFFAFSFFYSIISLLQGNEFIFLFFVFLQAINWINDQKFTWAGLLISLLIINPQAMMFPLLILVYFIVIKKGWNTFLWFFISLGLLIVASYILSADWPFAYLRAIFTNGTLSGMSLPGTSIERWFTNANPILWDVIALACVSLMLFELFISNMGRFAMLWMISLVITLTPLVSIQKSMGIMCFLLLPFMLLFQQWSEKSNKFGKFVIIISFILFSIFLSVIGLVTRSLSYEKPFPFIFYILPIPFLLLNLYWVRSWMINKINNFLD